VDGNFGVSEDSFLYIGDLWRIRANNSAGGPKKMQFEYSDDNGVTFKLGVPFIRTPGVSYASAPYLVTPTLTSNTSDSNFLITAAPGYFSEPYNLFDANQNAGWQSSTTAFSISSPYAATSTNSFNTGSATVLGPWVKITLNEVKKFNYYRLSQHNNADLLPVDFTLYASNDNVSYAVINQQTGYNLLGDNNVWNPKILLGDKQYRYIVFQVTRISGSGANVFIRSMDLGYQ
jgi:hypothetical protein